MCPHCNKAQTRYLVWVDDICDEVHEGRFCTERFGEIISNLRLDQWQAEYIS